MLETTAHAIARNRGLELVWTLVQENAAVPCDPALTARLEHAVAAIGVPVVRLPSGAGHDGVIISTRLPVAMLFVRCQGGISHNPAESVTDDDVAAAIAALDRFLDIQAGEWS